MRKRSRGETNQKGETKALILLYIASKGTAQTDDIREYLKNKEKGLRIKTKNLVYKHLKELETNGFIKRIPKSNNQADAFQIQEGFENFKNTYHFMQDLELELDLISTPYYSQYLESDEFIVKLVLNTFKESILRVYEDITQDFDAEEFEKYEEQHDEELKAIKEKIPLTIEGTDFFAHGKKTAMEIRESLKNGDKDNRHAVFKMILQEVQNNGIDTLHDKLIELIERNENRNKNISPDQALKIITGFFIPQHERGTISNIFKTSPLAIEYVLDIGNHSPITFLGILLNYFFAVASFDTKKIELLSSNLRLTPAEYDYLMNYSNIEGDSPLVRLIKSAFIIDYFDDNILKNSFSDDLLNEIISIKAKEAYKA